MRERGRIMRGNILKKQGIISGVIILLLIANMFAPYSVLIPKTYAATVVPEVPTVEVRKNLTSHPYFGQYLTLDVYFKGDIIVYGMDFYINYDSSKIIPAYIDMMSFQLKQTDSLANSIGTTVVQPYTMFYAANQSYLNIAEETIRVVMAGNTSAPNPADSGGELKAFSIMFVLADGVTDEDLTKDMFSFIPIAGGVLDTGFQLGYDGDNDVGTITDTTYLKDTSYMQFTGFAEGAKTVSSINIVENPTKTIYDHGDNIDLTGGRLSIEYSDGSSEEVDMTSSDVSITSGNPATVGTTVVELKYKDVATSFNITVNDPVDTIELTTPITKTEYSQNESVDLTGGVVTATTKSGVKTTINLPNASITSNVTTADLTAGNVQLTGTTGEGLPRGVQTGTLTYEGKTVDFDIVVNDTIASIAANGAKTTYNYGDSLDKSQGNITVTTGSGENITVKLSHGSVQITGYNPNQLGNQELTVEYLGKTNTYNVTVNDYVTGISVTNPSKTNYDFGEDINLAGGSITETMASGASGTTTALTESMISGYNKNSPGSQTIKVTYNGFESNFSVSVTDTLVSIEVTGMKTEYTYGESLDFTGAKLKQNLASGTSISLLDFTQSMITSTYNPNQLGEQTLNISHDGVNGTFIVNVKDVLDSIAINTSNAPVNKYGYGETVAKSGEIIASYVSGATKNIALSSTGISLENTDSSEFNTESVTFTSGTTVSKDMVIKYAQDSVEKSVTYPVTIVNTLTGISIQGTPQSAYNVNDSFQNNLSILVSRIQGAAEAVLVTEGMVTGFNTATEGTRQATITYIENGITKTVNFNYTVTDTVTKVEMNANPSKTTYNYGEDLDLSGTTITVTKGSGSETVNVDESMISGYNPNKLGSQTVTVEYGGQTTTFDVTVNDYVTGITVTAPTKTEYKYNEDLVLDGGKVTTVMASGATGTDILLSDSSVTLSGYDKTAVSSQTVTATYAGHSGTFNVNVVDEISNIVVTVPTSTQVYNHGDNIDLTGATITVNYVSGATPKTVTPTSSMVFEQGTTTVVDMTPDTYDNTNKLTKTVTLSYTEEGKTGSENFSINIINNVTKIEMYTTPKTVYNVNDSLEVTNGEILVTRAVGTPEVVTITEAMVTGFDSSVEASNKALTVTYTENGIENTTTYNINVVDSVNTISIKGTPKTEYNYGENLEELTITAVSGSGSKDVTVTESMISGYNPNQLGSQTVTVEYGGQTTTFDVTVNDYVTGITVTAPTKTEYKYNEDLVLDGGKVTTVMASGSTGTDIELTDSSVTLSGYDKTAVSAQTITVTYQGHSGTFSVNVKDDIESITLKGTPKTDYGYNEDLDVTNLSIEVVKPSGTTTVQMTDPNVSITGYDKTKFGEQTVVITYNGTEVGRYNVTVTDPIINIEMGVTPKTVYIKGETLDVTNGTIIVNKESGATETVNITDAMISGFDTTSTTDSQTLTVTYTVDSVDYTTTYDISVVNPVKSIIIDNTPKTSYNYGEALDLSSGTLEVTFEDNTKLPVNILSSMVTEMDGSQFNPNQLGTRNLKVTYGGKEVTYEITVSDYIQDIVFIQPTKIEYILGESIDLTGGSVQEIMASGTTTTPIDLTDPRVSVISFDNTIKGTQTVKLGFNGEEFTYQIEIEDSITSITLDSSLAKKTYKYGEDISESDLVLNVEKASGVTEKVDVTLSMISGYNSNQLGSQTITVTYNSQEFTYDVIVEDYITGYELTKPSKLVYELNEDLDLTGASLVEKMASGITGSSIAVEESMISGFDSTTTGAKTLKVTYNGTEMEFGIVVNDDISGIKIVTLPNKTEYKYGESLDLSGGKLEISNESGATEEVDMSQASVSGYDPNKLGKQTIILTYKGQTVEFTVNVIDYVDRVEFMQPTKTNYSFGEQLDLAGGKIQEVMASGAIGEVKSINAGMVSGFNNQEVGKQQLKITDNGNEFTYSVTVIDSILSITINRLPDKLSYEYNEGFDSTGGSLTIRRQSGTSVISMTNNMISGYDATKSGSQVLTAAYAGYKVEFTVSVGEQPIIPVPPIEDDDDDDEIVGGVITDGYDGFNLDLSSWIPVIAGILSILGAGIFFIILAKFKRNVKVYIEDEEGRFLIGKEKLSSTDRVLDLTKYYDRYHEDEFQITLSKDIVKKINNKKVQVIVHNKDKDILVSMKNRRNTYKV